jgi:hypothetical protein
VLILAEVWYKEIIMAVIPILLIIISSYGRPQFPVEAEKDDDFALFLLADTSFGATHCANLTWIHCI